MSDTARADLMILTGRATLALLIFGLLSFWRMRHRDHVTAEYKRTTDLIRKTYRKTFQAECPELRDYKLELEVRNEREKQIPERVKRGRRIKQMGYTQTLAVLNGVLLITFEWATGLSWLWSVPSGLTLIGFLCIYGAKSPKKQDMEPPGKP